MYKSYSMELAGRTLTVDIDRVAKQANGEHSAGGYAPKQLKNTLPAVLILLWQYAFQWSRHPFRHLPVIDSIRWDIFSLFPLSCTD